MISGTADRGYRAVKADRTVNTVIGCVMTDKAAPDGA
jgi:hypothetical protein